MITMCTGMNPAVFGILIDMSESMKTAYQFALGQGGKLPIPLALIFQQIHTIFPMLIDIAQTETKQSGLGYEPKFFVGTFGLTNVTSGGSRTSGRGVLNNSAR